MEYKVYVNGDLIGQACTALEATLAATYYIESHDLVLVDIQEATEDDDTCIAIAA